LECLGVYFGIILRMVLNKWGVTLLTGFIWLTIESSVRFLSTW